MNSEKIQRPSHLGFLTALGNSADGLIGGLLVLNMVGRPVEFHCTAPVRPNRAQEILYGHTLHGFICGEQIAPALVSRTKVDLFAILTNNPDFLTAYQVLNIPLGIVFSHTQFSSDNERYAVWKQDKDRIKNEDPYKLGTVGDKECQEKSDSLETLKWGNSRGLELPTHFFRSLNELPIVPGVEYSLWSETVRGNNRMALPTSCESESYGPLSFNEIVSGIEPFLKFIDSIEPFERIRLAVEEAQKSC